MGILHTYHTVFHGFSASLTPAQAAALRRTPAVLAVFPDRLRRPHTTRSPQFLGLVSSNPRRPHALLSAADAGAGTVIAVLDTGIRPDHRSFSAEGLPPPPSRWRGACEPGPKFPANSCNRKLLGARFFPAGFLAASKRRSANATNSDVLSPWDSDGHGTHTASTAAGAVVSGASLFGFAAGEASGVAPRARVAAYKVCWSPGCFDSDILAAIDRAVDDGADVVSLSVGASPAPYHLDPIAVGAFAAAARHGVFVAASAGNDGPGEMTATNVAPWIATVGAGTIDRRFPADVVLGDGARFPGASLYAGERVPRDRWFQLVYAGNVSTAVSRSTAPFCAWGSLDPALTRGRVVLCERGGVRRVEKGLAVKAAGGAGAIIANQFFDGEGVVPDAHLIPAVAVGYSAGNSVHAYVRSATAPRVRLVFGGTQVGFRPAPVVAAFSGRGPSAQSPYLIKPDLIAPGVGILAGWAADVGPTNLPADARRTEFNIMSGTSMACPHASGVAALLKAAHPDWSPAAIRSAMMTTAYVTDNLGHDLVDESSGNRSTEWAHGAGHMDPEKAVEPSLVYNTTADDFLNFLCASNYTEIDIRAITRTFVKCSNNTSMPWDLNYPSILVMIEQSAAAAAGGRLEAVVRRRLTSVVKGRGEYRVSIREPAGVAVAVEPAKLVFDGEGRELEFRIRVSADAVKLSPGSARTEFGSITWSDGKRRVRSPIGFTWQQPY
ncbi:Subtilisin-like protease SBT1.6 [Ananas comosus]|uniref:Subtilisin-like protease SBT1.6 n=1 Tax=Ananas comosus TaxID=4615 RepID=A0A199V215_ANACO|nr:Subtilisin-like protease SBT1.6 [Ananas comosus]